MNYLRLDARFSTELFRSLEASGKMHLPALGGQPVDTRAG